MELNLFTPVNLKMLMSSKMPDAVSFSVLSPLLKHTKVDRHNKTKNCAFSIFILRIDEWLDNSC